MLCRPTENREKNRVHRREGLLYGLLLLFFSCTSNYHIVETAGLQSDQIQGGEFTILCWNIGYGAMRAGADFIADGGKNLIASSREEIKANIAQITGFIKAEQCTVMLFQEMTLGTLLNYSIDILKLLQTALPAYNTYYSPKVNETLFFFPNNVGQAIFSTRPAAAVNRLDLYRESGLFTVTQQHHLVTAKYFIPGQNKYLVIGNVHLSAFDKNGLQRYRQLELLRDFMDEQRTAGNYAVIGGDWNLVFGNPGRPFDTQQKDLFWIYPLPADFPGAGWKRVYDPTVPTVRTLEKPYQKDKNYTTIIDGFIITENVEVIEIKTLDLDFRYSDHQPLYLHIRTHL